jgi:hypothetical protein
LRSISDLPHARGTLAGHERVEVFSADEAIGLIPQHLALAPFTHWLHWA